MTPFYWPGPTRDDWAKITLSSGNIMEYRTYYDSNGAHHFIVKPTEKDELIQEIKGKLRELPEKDLRQILDMLNNKEKPL